MYIFCGYIVGIIRIIRVLDCESVFYYWFTIYVTDRGLVFLYVRYEVYIKVIDVNDNIFQMRQLVYIMNVTENLGEGIVVGQVQVYDDDVIFQQELSYSIVEMDFWLFFTINKFIGIKSMFQLFNLFIRLKRYDYVLIIK